MIGSTPTTKQVQDDLVAAIEGEISQTVPLFPKAFTRVLAKALAGSWMLLYKYAGWMFLQLFIRHASYEETTILGRKVRPLVEHGIRNGTGEPEPATNAELTIDVTVTQQSGSLPVNTQLVNTGTGVIYLTTTGVSLDAEVKSVNVVAASDPDGNGGAGAVGNMDDGATLSFVNPVDNVEREAVVTGTVTQGADAETPEHYRDRVLQREKNEPQGGAPADYRAWALKAAGIVNVYPYKGSPGEIDVYVEATEDSSGSADGIPTAAQLSTVEDIINQDENGKATRRPIGDKVNVLPITRKAFDVVVQGLVATDAPTVQGAIEEAADDVLRTREPFIEGLSALPRKDRITRSLVAGVVDRVASASGAAVNAVVVEEGGIQTVAYTLAKGEKAKLGNVSFE